MAYIDPIIARLISTFNAEGPAELKNRYSPQDPGALPPRSQLPWCFISYDPQGQVKNITNMEDESNIRLTINLVDNQTQDYGQAFNVESGNKLLDFMMGRDADYTLKSTSLLYILRKHQALDTKVWINLRDPIEVDGGVSFGKRGLDTYAREGIIKIVVTQHQIRPGFA